MKITAIGYPFIFGYNAICGILRGMGESKRPLIFILVAAVINIVLDIVLVAVFRLDAAGTAIATALSQMGSCMAAFCFLWKRREHFDFELKPGYFKMDREILFVLIRLGIPQVVRSMFVRVGMLWVNANANAFGLVVSATNSVGNKLQKFLEVFVQGIDTASASMVGQNLGAKKIDRAGKTTICTYIAATCCAAVSSALCLGTNGLVPGDGYRLRLCGTGVPSGASGRHRLQDRVQHSVHECVWYGIHRPVVGRRLLPHSAGLHLCGVLPQRPLEDTQTAVGKIREKEKFHGRCSVESRFL